MSSGAPSGEPSAAPGMSDYFGICLGEGSIPCVRSGGGTSRQLRPLALNKFGMASM